MFKENDVVILTRNVEDMAVGAEGTIVAILEESAVYLVEFLDEQGNTISILEVNKNDIERIWESKP